MTVQRRAEQICYVALRAGRYSIPGNIQDGVGQGSEQPDLVENVPAYCRWVGLDEL